jgi:hypothetical protein
LSEFPRGQDSIDILVAIASHFWSACLELFGSTGHYRNAVNVFGINFFLLGIVRFDDRPQHFLRTLAGRKIWDVLWVKSFDVLNPTRGTTREHRQNAAIFDATNEFCRFLHNGQVGTETGVKYGTETQVSEHGVHFSHHVGSGSKTEFFAEGNRHCRSMLNDDVQVRITQCRHHTSNV